MQGTKRSGSKLYSVASVAGWNSSFCFGLVGPGSGSFCVRKGCVVQSHGIRKCDFQGKDMTCVFIVREQGDDVAAVYSNPCVDESKVPPEVRAEWRTKLATPKEWAVEFQAVENADSALATSEDIKDEASLLVKAERFRTPLKKRKEDDIEWEDDTLGELIFEKYTRTLPNDESAELTDMIANKKLEKGMLTKIVARLESSTITQDAVISEVAVLSHKRFLSNERDLRLMSGAVQKVQLLVGSPVELDTRFEGPTLWSSTSFIADEVVRLNLGLTGVERTLEPMKKSVLDVKLECERLASVVSNEKLLKILVMVSNKMKEASEQIVLLKAKVGTLEGDMEASRAGVSPKPSDKSVSPRSVDAMDELIHMLDEGARVDEELGDPFLTPERLGSRGKIGVASRPSISDQEGTVRALMAEVKMLKEDMSLLKGTSDDKSIKFGGLGLRSIQECHSWIKSNFAGYRYGLIMDPLLMLDRIFGSDDIEADSQFKTLESRVKLKITTGAEAAAIKALHFKRPRIFHKGRVSMTSERNKSKLNKIADYKVWKAGGEGVRNHIVHQMNLLHVTLSNDIGYAFGSNPELAKAQLLAMMSLNATITFLTQLLSFVDTIYEKLFVYSKFTAEQGWSLTTQILDRICEDLFAPKEGVAAAMTVEDPASICSHMLWSCFKTHDVMTAYMEYSFENHPAISAEYVKFLATNSGFDKVEKMEATVHGIKASAEKAAADALKARQIADGASSQAGVVAKNLDVITKRVSKVEDKIFK